MRKAITYVVGLGCVGVAVVAAALTWGQSPRVPNPDSQYRLGPDSLPQEGVPKGEIRGPITLCEAGTSTPKRYWRPNGNRSAFIYATAETTTARFAATANTTRRGIGSTRMCA